MSDAFGVFRAAVRAAELARVPEHRRDSTSLQRATPRGSGRVGRPRERGVLHPQVATGGTAGGGLDDALRVATALLALSESSGSSARAAMGVAAGATAAAALLPAAWRERLRVPETTLRAVGAVAGSASGTQWQCPHPSCVDPPGRRRRRRARRGVAAPAARRDALAAAALTMSARALTRCGGRRRLAY
mmetsp:Transcript_10730/g.43422  ORF Transcript_10730/g.43422 Transcript_10730/m.43422 type:complete len:189 (+) Transcript_10730:629-1195(+)